METKMYISNNETHNNGHTGTKYASTNSIPSMMEDESSFAKLIGARRDSSAILRDNKGRRHSVLEDLKARRDSLFQRARRGSVVEEKENAKLVQKEKRRSSDGGRRGSVFYVSQDLLEENQEVLEDERMQELEGKKGRRKSWHPLAKPPKLDRKRRKGIAGVPTQVGSTDGLYTQARQKRPSWWNIFVPDSVGRYLFLESVPRVQCAARNSNCRILTVSPPGPRARVPGHVPRGSPRVPANGIAR